MGRRTVRSRFTPGIAGLAGLALVVPILAVVPAVAASSPQFQPYTTVSVPSVPAHPPLLPHQRSPLLRGAGHADPAPMARAGDGVSSRHSALERRERRAQGAARRARAALSSTSIEPRCSTTTPSTARRRSTRFVVGLDAPARSPMASWVRGTTTVRAPSGAA